MGVPQIPDQVKKAPTLALRAFFAGIGKILLAADRPPVSSPASQPAGSPASQLASPTASPPPPSGPRHAAPGRRAARSAGSSARTGPRWRSLDETGNVRVLADEEPSGSRKVVAAPDGASSSAAGRSIASQVLTTPVATQPLTGNVPVGASLVIHELPLPGFNTMSVAAIRARLRTLDVDQLQALLVHESKSAQRQEVIAMIERRIEKIESGG
jgi:hypothetical protein